MDQRLRTFKLRAPEPGPMAAVQLRANFCASLHDCAMPDSSGAIVQFSRKQTIFIERDKAPNIYKIISGAARLSKITPDGRRQIVQFLLPDDYLGACDGERRTLTAEAIGDVTALSYPVSRLAQDCLLTMLRADISAYQDHLIMLGLPTAHERVATFIVALADRCKADKGLVPLAMNRVDIAEYLGLTIETVSRLFSGFRRAGIIGTPSRHLLKIRNRAVLQRMARGHLEQSAAPADRRIASPISAVQAGVEIG